MMKVYVLLRHVFDLLQKLFVLRAVWIPWELEDEGLKSCNLRSSISHGLYSNRAIVVPHGADGVDYQGNIIVFL